MPGSDNIRRNVREAQGLSRQIARVLAAADQPGVIGFALSEIVAEFIMGFGAAKCEEMLDTFCNAVKLQIVKARLDDDDSDEPRMVN
jgi:hypothetical protein